jgi:hypothetical protein
MSGSGLTGGDIDEEEGEMEGDEESLWENESRSVCSVRVSDALQLLPYALHGEGERLLHQLRE